MSDKKRKVYVVWSNTDLNEGRGYEFALNVCETMATAIRRGKGQYVQGGDCRVTEFESPFIDGQWLAPYYLVPPTKEDIATQARLDVENNKRKARDAAIEKAKKLGLSDEDISALKGGAP